MSKKGFIIGIIMILVCTVLPAVLNMFLFLGRPTYEQYEEAIKAKEKILKSKDVSGEYGEIPATLKNDAKTNLPVIELKVAKSTLNVKVQDINDWTANTVEEKNNFAPLSIFILIFSIFIFIILSICLVVLTNKKEMGESCLIIGMVFLGCCILSFIIVVTPTTNAKVLYNDAEKLYSVQQEVLESKDIYKDFENVEVKISKALGSETQDLTFSIKGTSINYELKDTANWRNNEYTISQKYENPIRKAYYLSIILTVIGTSIWSVLYKKYKN